MLSKTTNEGTAEEFECAILYSVNGEKDCSVRWAKNATKALKKFGKEVDNYILHDIHKI